MCGIARHLLARHWEAERRAEVTRSRLRAVADEQVRTDEIEELARREEVASALGRLPALQRQVLTLK
jgi:DNA-directed RNA polymerase specialized sigma24 family protein